MTNSRAEHLVTIQERIERGQRLTREDALALFQTREVIRLGRLADQVKQARWGDRAHFVINRQINPSNVCVLSCRFCDFATKRGRPNAYEMTIQEVVEKCNPELREVHIVGGLHPDWPWSYYLELFRAITSNFPHIKAYWVTMGEEIASVALHFGADDIDGTIGEERIMHAADASSPVTLTRARLIDLIREAGCTPVERDALYRIVQVHGDGAHCESSVS